MMKIYEIRNSVLYRLIAPKFSCTFKKRQDGSYEATNIVYDSKTKVDVMQLAKIMQEAGDFYADYLKEHIPPNQ